MVEIDYCPECGQYGLEDHPKANGICRCPSCGAVWEIAAWDRKLWPHYWNEDKEALKMSIQEFVEKTNDRNVDGWRDWDMHHFVLGLCGEVGELANNAKKHSRFLVGWKGKALNEEEFVQTLKDELPDIMIYLCLIAGKYNLDLQELVKKKVEVIKYRFNWR